MQFETFRGRNMKEALAQVKATLGQDALIESTRHVSSGGQGLFEKSFVEVVAALPVGMQPKPIASGRPPSALRAVREISALASGSPFPLVRKAKSEVIDQELRVIRGMLEQLSQNKRPRDRAGLLLQAAGIEGTLASQLAKGALRAAQSDTARLFEVLRRRLLARLATVQSPLEIPGPRIITCIGPTGAGKSTTIAKLAARAHLDLGRSVAVITLDTYRVGAIEQMRRFVDLIGVPLDVAQTRAQFAQSLAQRRAELTLVDTAGISTLDKAGLAKLADCLQSAGDRTADVLLVVQAGIRARDVERLKALYRNPSPTALCITKLDETSQAGGAVHAALDEPLPLAFLCDGPRVPEDIRSASAEALVDAVLPPSLIR
jgi:flagellar biosynthesis protein FlhF